MAKKEKIDGVFAERLSIALERSGMRSVDLSKATGLSESTISQYRGGYTVPKFDKMAVIAKVLQVNPSWLYGLTDDDVVIDAIESPQLIHMGEEVDDEDERLPYSYGHVIQQWMVYNGLRPNNPAIAEFASDQHTIYTPPAEELGLEQNLDYASEESDTSDLLDLDELIARNKSTAALERPEVRLVMDKVATMSEIEIYQLLTMMAQNK